jgi:hypothetical protein
MTGDEQGCGCVQENCVALWACIFATEEAANYFGISLGIATAQVIE